MSEKETSLVEHAKDLLVKITDHTINGFVENTVATSLQAIQKAVTPKGFMKRLCHRERKYPTQNTHTSIEEH